MQLAKIVHPTIKATINHLVSVWEKIQILLNLKLYCFHFLLHTDCFLHNFVASLADFKVDNEKDYSGPLHM